MKKKITIDITSDIMCPWCIIGFKRLQKAMDKFRDDADFNIHWLPFELNPRLPETGVNRYEYISEKYGRTKEEALASGEHLKNKGAENGFVFNFNDNSKMYNTANAHLLLHWADEFGKKQTELKVALFEAHFTHNKNISDHEVLLEIAEKVGLDKVKSEFVLNDDDMKKSLRAKQREVKKQGISTVPAYLFNNKIKVGGSDGDFEQVIHDIVHN
jgi:predicted DsbA family dithiol-disulfide isomerase